jgi:hypothetical protein
MSERPFSGAFPHQHGDPRGLIERIQAQLRDRIEEAVEMAALDLLVNLRRRDGRPAPESSSTADRKEFEDTARRLLAHLGEAFRAEASEAQRADLARAEAKAEDGRRLIEGQVFLARQLPDYWQRFEQHRTAYARARLESPPARAGWLGRLLR